jgi:hypothetical protein
MKIELDRLTAPILGVSLHAWRVVFVASLGQGCSTFRLRLHRQPGCYASRTCFYAITHYVTLWR